jgi:hypothetical protein
VRLDGGLDAELDAELDGGPEVEDNQFERWYGVATTFVGPATLLSALLFYFGYVSSRAQFLYFGVDVDAIGLGTRDYVMRSPQPLLVPLLLVGLVGASALVAHLMLERRTVPRRVVLGAAVVSALVLGSGVALLLAYPVVGGWPLYGVVTPLALAVGAGLAMYSSRWVVGRPAAIRDRGRRTAVRASLALGVLVVATSLFWATATVAEWTGRGVAMSTARELHRLPLVILDTQERLYLTDGIVEEFELPAESGQTFRYRYRGFRLLVHGGDRLFLVPSRWSSANSTLVVPLDGSVRVQFRFVDLPPTGAGRTGGSG